MSFSKTIFQSDNANVTVSESAGGVIISATASATVGGGAIANVLSVKSTNEISLSGQQLLDAAFGYAESKFPSVAQYLALAQKEIDSLIAKA